MTIRSIPERLARKLNREVRQWSYRRRRPLVVEIDRLLMGGDYGFPSAQYARIIGAPMRPSTPVTASPHAALLSRYVEIGDLVLEPAEFRKTAYWQNAMTAISYCGAYFDAIDEQGVLGIATDFITRFKGGEPATNGSPGRRFQTPPDEPILVRPIKESDCFEVIDGHHRIAVEQLRGRREISVCATGEPAYTPLQQRVRDVMWTGGRAELYQPIDAPEVRTWTLTRRCTDRLEMMLRFLQAHELIPPQVSTYLDIASSYGWFVAKMAEAGFASHGVERDPIAASIGQMAYGVPPQAITRSDCTAILRETKTRYDITSCFSLMHHFVLGRGNCSPEELLRLIDRATNRVLFFDTGQCNEAWFCHDLKQWNPDYIANWIRSNSTFSSVLPLGIDQDRIPPFEDNYSRTLFACMR